MGRCRQCRAAHRSSDRRAPRTGLEWRWAFFVNVPIVLVAAAVTVRSVPSRHPSRPPTSSSLFEVVPATPLRLFRCRAFSTANGVALTMNLGTLGLLFVLTTFLQTVQGRSALDAGLAVLPLFLPLTVLAPVAGRITARIGPRSPMLAGLLVAGGGVALVATWSPTSSYAHLLPAMLCWGIGRGLLTPAVVTAALRSAPPHRAGLASGVNNTARQAGGAIGVAAGPWRGLRCRAATSSRAIIRPAWPLPDSSSWRRSSPASSFRTDGGSTLDPSLHGSKPLSRFAPTVVRPSVRPC